MIWQAKTGILRAEEGRTTAESKVSSVQASLERSQAAYNQAKGYIQELEKARDVKVDYDIQNFSFVRSASVSFGTLECLLHAGQGATVLEG